MSEENREPYQPTDREIRKEHARRMLAEARELLGVKKGTDETG